MNVSYISDQALARRATAYLNEHGHQSDMPVDIERLCEEVGVSILPTPELFRTLHIDAFLTNNCTMIVIDQNCFDNNIPRARFSIAHELSHKILHESIYTGANITDIQTYQQFQSSIDSNLSRRIETQAHSMAGHLLMPPHLLNAEIASRASSEVSALSMTEAMIITRSLPGVFNVSAEALMRQLAAASPEFHKVLLKQA